MISAFIVRSEAGQFLADFADPDHPAPLQILWTADLTQAHLFVSMYEIAAAAGICRRTPGATLIAHPQPDFVQALMNRRFNSEVAEAKAMALTIIRAVDEASKSANANKATATMALGMASACIIHVFGDDSSDHGHRTRVRQNFIDFFTHFSADIDSKSRG